MTAAYCYADGLHMSLPAAGADAGDLPEPGFLEGPTTMPFGAEHPRLEDGPLVFFNSPAADPDSGLSLALEALGWTCEERYGTEGEEEALVLPRGAAREQPVLAGPLEMRHLPRTPGHSELAAADHFVVLTVDEGRVLVHDPCGYPYAPAPVRDSLSAWRDEDVPYKRGPYKLRSESRRERDASRQDAVSKTLPIIRTHLKADSGGPIVFGGERGLRLLDKNLNWADGQVVGSPDLLRPAARRPS